MTIQKIKTKYKQMICKHKNVEYKQPIQQFHALNTEKVYTFCADCGKLLKKEEISNEEFLMRFKI